MTTNTPDEPTLDPRLEDEVTPEVLRGAGDDTGGGTGRRPDNPGEPTPGSDNDGPEEGYTPPEELPPRATPEPPD